MKISLLIPCHNEEKSIRSAMSSWLAQSRPFDQILVVDHASTDKSLQILKTFGKKIELKSIDAPGNKSYVQEYGLKFITGDIVVCTDADTLLDRDFVKHIEKNFQDKNVMAVAGYVKSLRKNWITLCRAFDYVTGQNIHKLAQHFLGYIFVIPGAASAFRTKVFKEIVTFDHDTVTEDLDFTYKFHKKKLKIVFERKAISYTQDPDTLKSYVGQMRRWYGGGWQNLIKHFGGDLFENPRITLELSLIYLEGLVFSLLIFLIPLFSLVAAAKFFGLLLIIVFLESIYAAIIEKRLEFLLIPIFYPFMMYVNSYISLEQFVKEGLLKKRNLVWFHPERRAI